MDIKLFHKKGAEPFMMILIWRSPICFYISGRNYFYSFSGEIILYTSPAKMAPAIGAAQNSHNWSIAQSPTNIAWLVLLAGFTEVFVTGMLIKCIRVKANPMANPANPLGAFDPLDTLTNLAVVCLPSHIHDLCGHYSDQCNGHFLRKKWYVYMK